MMSKERYPPFSLWRILFSFSSSLLLNAKKAPAHHISVKGRGLLLLDSNSVWRDGTTISFYRVSVPYQIFNYPPDAGNPHHRGFASWIMWFIRLWSQESHVVSKKSTRGTTEIATPSTSMSESSSQVTVIWWCGSVTVAAIFFSRSLFVAVSPTAHFVYHIRHYSIFYVLYIRQTK